MRGFSLKCDYFKSILIPGHMVVQTEMLMMNFPTFFTPAGRDCFIKVIKLSMFSLSFWLPNDNFPTIECTFPSLSFLYSNLPALSSFRMLIKSSPTVPDFGFGMSPFGPKTFAIFPIFFIIAGVAIAMSKLIAPRDTSSTKSSPPARVAPASRSAFSSPESVKAATRTDLPLPWGRVIVPRTSWSLYFGSIPKWKWISTDGSNLTVFVRSRRSTASSSVYNFLSSTRVWACRYFFPLCIVCIDRKILVLTNNSEVALPKSGIYCMENGGKIK